MDESDDPEPLIGRIMCECGSCKVAGGCPYTTGGVLGAQTRLCFSCRHNLHGGVRLGWEKKP